MISVHSRSEVSEKGEADHQQPVLHYSNYRKMKLYTVNLTVYANI
jgi:hypothetical protein